MSRGSERAAAIAASIDDNDIDRDVYEAQAEAHAEDALRSLERDLEWEQKEILRQCSPARYISLKAWQEALKRAGFYFEDLQEYLEVVRHPDAHFGSYEDDGQ